MFMLCFSIFGCFLQKSRLLPSQKNSTDVEQVIVWAAGNTPAAALIPSGIPEFKETAFLLYFLANAVPLDTALKKWAIFFFY